MKKILIVEDFVSFNNTIQGFLIANGYLPKQAFTIAEAKEAIENEDFDFILLDLILPDGEGEEIVKLKRSGLKSKIVVFTGDDNTNRRERLFQNGILDFISKQNPYEYFLTELLDILESIDKNHTVRLLVVDDSKLIRHVVRDVLTTHEFMMEEAVNGKEALEKIEENEFDLILLDIELPDISGDKLLSKFRSKENLLKTPIIVISSTYNQEMVSKVLKHGANEFIHKPFSIEQLVLKIKIFIDLARSHKELEEFNKDMKKKVNEEIKRRETQDQILIHQSRQATMGEMIGNIAHQWRQPLNALSISLDNIEFFSEEGELTHEQLKQQTTHGKELIKKMSSTIDDFRDFFKPTKKRKEFNLKKVIDESMNIYKPIFLRSHIETELLCDETLMVKGYPNELSQVLMVIISNAKDAVIENRKENRKLAIEVKSKEKFVHIKIKDNGGGIPEKVLKKIFQPYFSTKGKEGTGVGLYMAEKIIDESFKGELKVKNVEEGAEFTIKLRW